MRLQVTTNGSEIARKLEKRADAFGSQFRRVQDQIWSELLEESRRILATEIYAVPIPRRGKTGKPKWTRKGELYQSEGVEIRGGNIVLFNRSGHAKQRRDLGTPVGRLIRSEGVKSVQWQEKALANKIGRIREFYREMNRPIVQGVF